MLMRSGWRTKASRSSLIQRQLRHADLGITTVYLQGIDSSEIVSTVHSRPSPTISATAGNVDSDLGLVRA